jgi:uncharacterized membrane protein
VGISLVIGAVVFLNGWHSGLSVGDAWGRAEGHVLVGLLFGVVLFPIFALMMLATLVCLLFWLVSDIVSDLVAYLGRI